MKDILAELCDNVLKCEPEDLVVTVKALAKEAAKCQETTKKSTKTTKAKKSK